MSLPRWLPAAIVAGSALVVARAEPDPAARRAEPSGSLREAIYFGSAGPVRIQFRVTIAGRPADAVWAEAVDKLFAYCDRNGDGVLDASERAFFVPPRRSREAEINPANASTVPLRLAFGRNAAGVSREDFAAAVREAGYGAVSLAYVAGRTDSAELSTALFSHLDRDHDGKLSVDEVKAARISLAPLDLNEDELLTAAEVLGRVPPPNAGPVVAVADAPQPEGASQNTPPELLFLPADRRQAVKHLLAARAGSRSTALGRKDLGFDAKEFAALDRDANGKLDSAELAAWLQQPADVSVALELDPARLTALPAAPGQRVTAAPGLTGAFTASISGAQFGFEPPRDGNPLAAWKATADSARDLFQRSAKEKGFVTRDEIEKQPFAGLLFDFADRNGDGHVDRAEIDAALRVLEPLAACRAEVRFVDRGNGLFELLDRNDDNQLSLRELVEAVTVLHPFADAGGLVGPKDLPRRFRVQTSPSGVPVVAIGPPRVMPAAPPPRPAATGKVPAWFSKMDRNGDGDVSLREFLGPLELFRKLDRDADGLISPDEARAASQKP
jgi:Ca2+-binding EF-hand superfamily protein